jgi:hypothetical protein
MTTILPKEPVVTDRKNVILSDAERRNLRRKLRSSVEVAQDVLNPRNQMSRFVQRKTEQAKDLGADAARVARNNAPIIGVAGVCALLLLARRPISNWISKRRKSKTPNTPEGE